MKRHLQQTAAGLGVLLALSIACAHIPAIGERCNPGDMHRVDARTALACRDNQLALFSCPGPKGCVAGAERVVSCDQSRNVAPTEACLPEYEGRGQCGKDGSLLQCTHGSWVKLACPSGLNCRDSGGSIACEAVTD